MRSNSVISIIVFLLIYPSLGFAIPFDGLWHKIREEDPSLQEDSQNLIALTFEKKRAELSWFPTVGIEGRAFSTNDAGLNFNSDLGQRQINTTDFLPGNLNNPGFHTFETASLLLDLPLYEGGAKLAMSKAIAANLDSLSEENKAKRTDAYIGSAKSYGKAISLSSAITRLETLQKKLQSTIGTYRIGNKSNLIGYSGLLGMKNLANRTESLLTEMKSSLSEAIGELSARSGLESSWTLQLESIDSFIDKYLPSPSANVTRLSLREKVSEVDALAASQESALARAVYLPKIGLFARENLTNGNRDSATSFTGGVYLKWQLFDPNHIDRISEAEAREGAKKAHVKVVGLDASIQSAANTQNEIALKKNLKLLTESEAFLEEQSQVTQKLFQNGSVSALQLAEMLNRRIDLILQLQTMESKLITVRADQVKLFSSGSQYE